MFISSASKNNRPMGCITAPVIVKYYDNTDIAFDVAKKSAIHMMIPEIFNRIRNGKKVRNDMSISLFACNSTEYTPSMVQEKVFTITIKDVYENLKARKYEGTFPLTDDYLKKYVKTYERIVNE